MTWYNPWDIFFRYARWRETYLSAHPERRLFGWLSDPLDIEDPPPPPRILSLGEKGKKIGGMVALVVIVLILASRDS